MGWSMDRRGIRTLFDHESRRLKQFELSGPRRERVSLNNYANELAARDAYAALDRIERTRLTPLRSNVR